ncbi:MAG: hypothetical protein UX80_C0003G0086 [Candidatus Amesbacteria bacterium GW2011_GWA2_47_11b]|uniref:Ribbon-helix-helix protein CopG domain-containing protein n=3 Tax=Candidatus Amesiibacteriota TaxID=1752730 RepID=A0A0G1SJX2_9BACT|nr:MAG: hypothetical protein UX42_C0004G0017 [Microgenomates group bacterium GW2011_GWC1_46_20]KKU58431.1 MAG: hypothetical protein UX80_C0003G0086 [Candidatus Amesbacteria bacterium GW2011_GWA2_47_11b]KKU69794.1 MAG: hypothetical protein UX92_C0009G0004 [Candidatus Amesbacteria bacterium GW2011_GWA1_47_20]KKU83991.1 MAG: hypothetical protein UY11_C0008G0004 [Candidatus Amesbacteria bacterium GW2011_GWC2_47_8]
MSIRKSQITAFSLPKETLKLLEGLQNRFRKSRSELLREMINFYVSSQKTSPSRVRESIIIDDSDANKILKLYYSVISAVKPKPTLVIGIGIISKKNKVIIGLRKTQDQHIKDLHWTFPSGKFNSLEFEKEIINTIHNETGLKAKVIRLIHARLIPDSPQKKVRIVALYYHCKLLSGKGKPGNDFKQIKWVPATEVHRHFTTSVADEITTFLGTL